MTTGDHIRQAVYCGDEIALVRLCNPFFGGHLWLPLPADEDHIAKWKDLFITVEGMMMMMTMMMETGTFSIFSVSESVINDIHVILCL